MGAKQRKHSATATGQRRIGLTSGAQSTTGWTELGHQPAETVWIIYLRNVSRMVESNFCHTRFPSSFSLDGIFWLFVSPGPLSLNCECMTEMIHLMFGIGMSNMSTVKCIHMSCS